MFNLLDHGYCNLIESWGSDERIIEAARMSTSGSFKGWGETCAACYPMWTSSNESFNEAPCKVCGGKGRVEGDEKLLRFLWINGHHSPFEMCGLTVEVQAPIMVFREWHRHRTFCIGGNVPLIFERPCDGKAYPKTIENVVKSWEDPSQRARLKRMNLRGIHGSVHVTDAWYSGTKRCYTIKTRHGDVTVTGDHLIKTPEGGCRLTEKTPREVMGIVSVRDPIIRGQHVPSGSEEWRSYDDYYDVSSHGRVRSWITPAKTRRAAPKIKTATYNQSGRWVVNIHGNHVIQISHMAARAFLEWEGCGQILHRDDNPSNNQPWNLYIGSPADNIKDQYSNRGTKKLREVPLVVDQVVWAGTQDTYDISVDGNHWFVANNIVVHNSYNEMSGRYTKLPDLYYIPTIKRIMNGAQSSTNKQGSAEGISSEAAQECQAILERASREARYTYEQLLEAGISRELARLVLPVSQYSRMRSSGNLRNWLHFLKLRMADNAQWEIRQYANAIAEMVKGHFPRTWSLFNEDV